MIKYENDCVDCGLPCRGSSCPYRHVKHYYCDKCGEDVEELYDYDNQELCEECAIEVFLESLEKVE